MTDLCVFLPTRHRPELAKRCVESFRDTKALDSTDLILVVDDDDDSYTEDLGVDRITVTRGTLITAVNAAASVLVDHYDALFLAADDLVFTSKGWDEAMLASLADMGGTGIVMPDDRRRYDVPEHPLISSDFVRELGHFAEPTLKHYYCVVPETRVLTANLDWVPIGKIAIGDELVGIDEYPEGPRLERKYRRATASEILRRVTECVTVELEDGREVTCSAEHRWLAKRRWMGKGQRGPGAHEWRESGQLRPGDLILSPLRTWERETSFDAGWLSGIFDGEGTCCRSGEGTYKATTLSVGQNPGHVLDRIEAILGAMDINYVRQKNHARKGPNYLCERLNISPRSMAMELLGRLQPVRLNAGVMWEDMSAKPRTRVYGVVKSVQPAGLAEVVSMTTSTGTYIAEGLVSHNCDNAWAELGKRSGLIRFCPSAVIEHRHYSIDPDQPHDATYKEAEDAHGEADLAAYQQWVAEVMPLEVARLRRKWNKDVQWVLSRVA